MKEYNFSAYRKENLHTLRTAYFWIKKELKLLKEEHNIQWKENDDHSWSVNIPLEGALDKGWAILAACFKSEETGLKSELIAQYWPKN